MSAYGPPGKRPGPLKPWLLNALVGILLLVLLLLLTLLLDQPDCALIELAMETAAAIAAARAAFIFPPLPPPPAAPKPPGPGAEVNRANGEPELRERDLKKKVI